MRHVVLGLGLVWLGACGGSGDEAGSGTGSGSGTADGDSGVTQSDDGDGDGGSAGDGGGACVDDGDCRFDDCCTCTPISGPAPDCSGLGCASPICDGLRATCNDGVCEAVLANCDPATVVCDTEPPQCQQTLPPVVDGCWEARCIPPENCDPECGGDPCPWRCPTGGDALTVLSWEDPQAVFESAADGKRFTCQLTFDNVDDDYECAAEAAAGSPFVVTDGTGGWGVCTPLVGTSTIGIATGNPQQCTFQCAENP